MVLRLEVGGIRFRRAPGWVLLEEQGGDFVVEELVRRQRGSRGWRLGRGVGSCLMPLEAFGCLPAAPLGTWSL